MVPGFVAMCRFQPGQKNVMLLSDFCVNSKQWTVQPQTCRWPQYFSSLLVEHCWQIKCTTDKSMANMWLSACANVTGLLQCICANYKLLVYLICSEIFVPCNIFTRFVRYTVILCAVQVFAMWFSLLLLDTFAHLLLNGKILLIPRTVYRMWQLSYRKCSNFHYVQIETKWRIWCNTILKHCCC